MDKTYLLAVSNLFLCAGIGFISFCRLKVMRPGVTLRRTQWEYALMLVAATAAGFSPWLGEWPGWAENGLAAAVLYSLLASGHVWRRDKQDAPPPSTDRAELS